MKFRLTYDGPLLASTSSDPRAHHKQELRKKFHSQLKRLWQAHPSLANWMTPRPPDSPFPTAKPLLNTIWAWQALSLEYSRLGYHFVPVVAAPYSLHVSLDILFLRPDTPGNVIRSGDIDNRLKTLFDALRMPSSTSELGGFSQPDTGEDPFFVLLEDDKLISHVAVETDVLLEPTPSANGVYLANDARLVITVTVRPYRVLMDNLHFA